MSTVNSVFRNLKMIPPGASYAILIRHAERPIIENAVDFGNPVCITERGIQKSREFGRNPIINNVNGVFSSPLLRCMQTAKEIMSAAGIRNLDIKIKNTLGNPGSYIQDPSLAGNYFIELSSREVIKRYLSLSRLDGFLTLHEGSKNLLNDILKDFCPGKSCSNLYISHDAVIMPFISYYTGEKFSDYWLDFLEGVVITYLDGNVKMIWNETEYPIVGASE